MKRATIFVALSSVLFFTGCHSKKEDRQEDPVTYTITTPLQKDTLVTKDYVAQIQSLKNIEIRAQEKGFLQKVYVDEGQYVHAGQTLFQIMPQLYEADLMKAKAAVEQSKIDLGNSSMLAKANIVSKNERAMSQAKLDADNADLRSAQIHLSFTTIKAPFSGIINRLPKKIGSLIDEGDLLTTLSDNSGVYAYFNVAEPEYINYQTHSAERQKEPVSLIMANGDAMPQKGFVENVEGEFDNETGNIAFRAKFPNPNQVLKNGETGKVRMDVPLKGALIIPQQSTYELQDQTYVFVVDASGRAKARQIKIAYELPGIYIISSGLAANERFLADGAQKVKDGDKLKTKYQPAADVIRSTKIKAD